MVSGGVDQNPWIIMTEMTVNGCQDSEAEASPAGHDSPKRQGKYPANDLPSPTDDPNATSGAACRVLARDYKTNTRIPRNNRNLLEISDLEELENTGPYKLDQGSPFGRPSFAMSPGCQQGSFPRQFPTQDVPRSMANNFDPPTMAAYSFSMLGNQSEAEFRQQHLTSRDYSQTNLHPKPQTRNLGKMDAKKGLNQGLNQKGTTPTKQYPQDVQNITARGYRQFDMNENTEDAETAEELSQDPELNEKGCQEN